MTPVSPIAAVGVIATVALAGRCPLDTFQPQHDQGSAEISGIADARQLVDISASETKGRS